MVGLCLVHSHPDTTWGEGIAEFSPRDDWYEQRLFPTIVGSRPEALSVQFNPGCKRSQQITSDGRSSLHYYGPDRRNNNEVEEEEAEVVVAATMPLLQIWRQGWIRHRFLREKLESHDRNIVRTMYHASDKPAGETGYICQMHATLF